MTRSTFVWLFFGGVEMVAWSVYLFTQAGRGHNETHNGAHSAIYASLHTFFGDQGVGMVVMFITTAVVALAIHLFRMAKRPKGRG